MKLQDNNTSYVNLFEIYKTACIKEPTKINIYYIYITFKGNPVLELFPYDDVDKRNDDYRNLIESLQLIERNHLKINT